MSVEVFDEVSIALKSFWEAVFLDENNKPLNWTKPLIKGINTPRLKLTVTATDGGVTKAYTGFELPDSISLSIYETVDHRVEKYLDDWMFGPNGVFNKEKGAFRTRSKSKITNIYRCIRFVTTAWENDAGQDAGVKNRQAKIIETPGGVKLVEPGIIEKNLNAKLIEPGIVERSLSVKVQDNITELERIVTKYIERKTGQYLRIDTKEGIRSSVYAIARPYIKTIIGVQQVASQLTAIASGVANQLLGRIPAMAVGRVVIPPPLIKVPVAVETGMPNERTYRNIVDVQQEERELEQELIAAIAKKNEVTDIESIKMFSHDKDNLSTQEIESIKLLSQDKGNLSTQEIESLKLYKSSESTEDEALDIKKYAHKEKVISTTDYTCAIEGYDIAEYDYESGGPVSYTVNLSVLDYKRQYS